MPDLLTIAECRAEGITEDAVGDERLALTIRQVTRYVELVTGRWFYPRTFSSEAPLVLDGSGMEALFLPAPVLELTALTENGDDVALGDVLIYGCNDVPGVDDRFTPMLKKAVYSLTRRRGVGGLDLRWTIEPRAVALAGIFGFIEGRWRGAWSASTTYEGNDAVSFGGIWHRALGASTNVEPGTDETLWEPTVVPHLIRQAALRLVVREYGLIGDPTAEAGRRKAQVKSETTFGNSYTLSGLIASAGFTGDPLIDDTLAMYRQRFGAISGGR